MLTSSFTFQQAHLTHTSQENLFRHPPKSPAQKLIRFTATQRASTVFLIISLLTFLTYFQDHWASPGFEKWQRYSNFHPTQFIWVQALQAFVTIEINTLAWTDSTFYVFVLHLFVSTIKCCQTQSTKEMKQQKGSVDEDKRIRKHLALHSSCPKAAQKQCRNTWPVRELDFVRYIVLFTKSFMVPRRVE